EAWLWAVATPFVFWLSSRFTLERSTWMTRIPLLILIGIVMAIAVYAAIDVLRPLLVVSRRVPRLSVGRDIANFRFVNELLFYFAILAAGYARVYFLRDREQAAHSARLQAQLAEARLDGLRLPLNPHFLLITRLAIWAVVLG